MPIYEFRCPKCRNLFEALRRIGEGGSSLRCPRCGARGARRVPSVFAAATGKPAGLARGGSRGCSGCARGSCRGCGS